MGFLIRWRPRKLAKRGDQQLSRTLFLLDARGVQVDPRDQTIIEQRLTQWVVLLCNAVLFRTFFFLFFQGLRSQARPGEQDPLDANQTGEIIQRMG
jgi:hypothetical protein